MKHISEYEHAVVISLLPNPMRHIATLRIEINPNELTKPGYLNIFDNFCYDLRVLGFGVSVDKNLTFNNINLPNVMEIVLAPYTSEVKIARDIAEELEKIFGENSVLNRVIIKKVRT